MIKKRIKKNLGIVIHVLTNGEAISLEGRDISVERVDPYGHRAFVEGIEMQDNRIAFTFRASEQNKLGVWKFIVWENYGKDGQTVVDRERALQLVASTDLETPAGHEPGLDVERVDLNVVDIEVGIAGPKGDTGMSLYELMVSEGRFSGTLMEFLDAQEQAMKQAGVDATSEVVEQTRQTVAKLVEDTEKTTSELVEQTGKATTKAIADAEKAAEDAMAAKGDADRAAQKAEAAADKQPRIIDGFWHVWNNTSGRYEATGVRAEGLTGATGAPGATGPVGPTGPQGPEGPAGKDADEQKLTELELKVGDIPEGESVSEKLSELERKVGDLNNLETTAKGNLVEAINEARQSGGGGGGGSTPIYDGLDSDATNKALSAKQGKVLNGKVSNLEPVIYDNFNDLTPQQIYADTNNGVRPWKVSFFDGYFEGMVSTQDYALMHMILTTDDGLVSMSINWKNGQWDMLQKTAYVKPEDGIPTSDLASEIQAILSSVNGKYQKPSTGIPKSDLSNTVQTSLNYANSAVQPSAISDMETKTHASQTYQPKGSYATSAELKAVSDKVNELYEDYSTALNLI